METEPQIVFEGMDPSDAVRARVEREIEKLTQFHDRITSCRVVLTAPDRHKTKGGLFRTKIVLVLPGGGEVVVDHNHPKDHSHEDIYVSIRDAFNAAQRQLKTYVRQHSDKPDPREGPPMGVVKFLNGLEGFGTIESADGYEVYFHQNAVVNGSFEDLKVGDVVRYHEEQGAKGPQASTVHPPGK
jgi:cold shock CspA family protein/ribosome-associated translation inhibitor RaiA